MSVILYWQGAQREGKEIWQGPRWTRDFPGSLGWRGSRSELRTILSSGNDEKTAHLFYGVLVFFIFVFLYPPESFPTQLSGESGSMPAFPKIQVIEERDFLGIYNESGGNAEEARRCIPQKGQALGLTKVHFCGFLASFVR